MAVGYKGYGTPEAVERQRAIAEALLGKVFGGRTPRTYGEAFGQGLGQVGAALASRGISKKADKAEREGRETSAKRSRSAIMDALTGKGQRPAPKVTSSSAQQEWSPEVAERGINEAQTNPDQNDFVGQMWPLAVEASKKTGLDPRLIVAQAAVETGWGKSAPGNNMFGIKSHGQPNGQNLETTEFRGGQPVVENASFRAYGSPAESAQDYTNFILENQRYKPVLEAEGLEGQLKALGQSGYATDPNYGRKVAQVAYGLNVPQGVPGASQTGVPSAPGGGQPPAQTGPQQSDMAAIDALTQVLNDPWASPADQQMAQMLLESQIARMQGPAPMSQYQRAQLGLGQQGLALDRAQFEFEKFKHNNPQLPKEAQLYQFAQENPEFAPFLQQMKGGGTRLRVNPQTGEVEFSQGGPGEMTSTSSGSPGLTQLDKDFATEYAAWTTGGQFDAEKNLSQLETAAQNLEQGGNITGAFLGMLPDSVLAVVNPEAVDTKQLVEEVVQRNLRSVLGAQFTEKEGERLIARAYNPQLDEETNRKRLQRLIGQMRDAYEAKNDAARYFQKNGTLRGWEGKLYRSADDFDLTEEAEAESGSQNEIPGGWSVEEVN